MPTYDYRCTKCGRRFEVFHGIKDETPRRCPRCKGRAVRVPAGGAGLLFKGSGFYITDYRSKSYEEKAKQEKPKPAPKTGGADAGGKAGGETGAQGGTKRGGEFGAQGGAKSGAKRGAGRKPAASE